MATPGTKLADQPDGVMLPKEYKSVLDILARYRSMPLLELTAKVRLDDEQVERIINSLEKNKMVRIMNRGDILEEVVFVEKKGLAAAG